MTEAIQKLSRIEKNPLVTFALFAYNQEKYIREAVESAFTQTYEPLEIILSDDCSTDRTFEIIQEMANEYKGPHKIKINRNNINLGLIEHINKICEIIKTDIYIAAAGDDISLPDRTKIIVQKFLINPNALAIHSKVIKINEFGEKISEWAPPVVTENMSLIRLATASSIHIGASAAYSMKIFKKFGNISFNNTYEDLVLGFRAALNDGLLYINEPLVLYRSGVGISTNRKPIDYSDRINLRVSGIERAISTARQRAKDCELEQYTEIKNELKTHIIFLEMRLQFYKNPIKLIGSICGKKLLQALHAISSESKFCLKIIE